MSSLTFVEILPSNKGKPNNLMIMAHGYGSSGQNLSELAKFLSPMHPDTLFLCPNAPEKADISDMTFDHGYQWFSLADRSDACMKAGVINGGMALHKFAHAQLARLSMTYEQVILFGFSQGTFVALQAALTMPHSVAGVIGCSGGFIFNALKDNDIKNRPIVRLIHGDCDQVLPCSYSEAAVRDLSLLSIDCSLHVIENLGHAITPMVMTKIVNFMREFESLRTS